MNKIGILGLGAMGSRIATRLIDKGFNVSVYNRSADKLEPYRNSAAYLAKSPDDLMEHVDVIITIVTDDSALKAVMVDSGILDRNYGGRKIIIDMSTISPGLTRDLAMRGKSNQIEWLDSPVLGSTPAVESGNLVFLVGGDKKLMTELDDLYSALGRGTLHIGENGAGQAAKIVHNLICGMMIESMGEGIALGEQMGLDRTQLTDVFSDSAFVSPLVKAKIPLILSREYKPMFKLELMRKDLGLALDNATELGLSLPALRAVKTFYDTAVQENRGGEDVASLIESVIENARK